MLKNNQKIFWALIWVLKKEKPTIDVGFGGVFVPGAVLLRLILNKTDYCVLH